MIKRRQALLTIGGMLLAGQCGRAVATSGSVQSIQSALGIAALKLRNAVPREAETHQMIELCGELTTQCQYKSTVSPALAQATLDSCQRSATCVGQSGELASCSLQVNEFAQLVRRFIEVTAG